MTAMVQTLRRFTSDDRRNLAFLMVYARGASDAELGKSGLGYPYRLEQIENSDTLSSAAV